MFNELSENLNSIKNEQPEMKYTLNEMNNLQGINSRVDEAKDQIRNLEYKEAKKKIRSAKRKKN